MGAGLKNLSSKEVVSILESFGFAVYSQKGSHIKLRRKNNETLMVPERKQVAKGTLRAIVRQASSHIPQSELHPHFYNN